MAGVEQGSLFVWAPPELAGDPGRTPQELAEAYPSRPPQWLRVWIAVDEAGAVGITAGEVAALVDLPANVVRGALCHLRRRQLVQRLGARRAGASHRATPIWIRPEKRRRIGMSAPLDEAFSSMIASAVADAHRPLLARLEALEAGAAPSGAVQREWLTLREVSEVCGVGERTVRRWVTAELLDTSRLGRSLRVHRDTLRSAITAGRLDYAAHPSPPPTAARESQS